MSRLIVVSNRVSAPTDPSAGSAGGLAMALSAALRKYDGLWFGWSGNTTPVWKPEAQIEDRAGVTVALVDLEPQDVDEYYNGYANKTLWPLFHHRVDLSAYERSFGEGYERTNDRFAEALAPLIQPDDLIWIHDYHMIPLARDLRRRGIKNRIGFFLHTPWPVRQLLVTLPYHRRLVESLFDFDLLGFHTREWLDLFRDYVASEPGIHGRLLPNDALMAFGKTVQTGVFPIGIDVDAFVEARNSALGIRTYDRMAASAAFRSMIVGVDRLDYSKGLEQRLLGYEQFLKDNPEQRGKVFLLQVTPLSRDDVDAYQDIRSRLDSLAGHVNGTYGDVDWQPVRYLNRTYRRDQLAGIYRAARVGLVTPLRDGMNLVAKEYVAAQDPEDPGVLILSRFAGAAEEMTEALLINPFSREEISDALSRALAMPLAERKDRWQALMQVVRDSDVALWRDMFVATLQAIPTGGAKPVPEV
ncbi:MULTISPECIES: alpha,alpha-trehalose-phosphate synthase (UDP-forming) [unclassified Brevundimonas]|jgi:trehalose 6-phosphate synthase|uniref:alpha,alpha-trehalose-phosphate synthase (UDP-forming) n=1 Tax=unclassified Brevundimonas TaxID=2622653 RepID=UPI000C4F197F|nr:MULTISPECIES: trehalose-6-phosphate synthase [unclassified Brevundimonas]MAL88446.1 trehalose-6-phosphate synthase [Brevundimonas sp.]HAJ03826.1 trehalose-6-phosphate synthase [Brevundimonas sp.]HAV50808.1 trehalose-6-phosphate synthase [Brevundimonas sp.]|tara:strand:+ start:22553 stop:23965 length:1413 start_codon:yes stop_codon:yes gene_type:complete